MKRISMAIGLIIFTLVIATVFITSSVFAASSASITITANPLFLSIINTPNTWTLNGITGSGRADTNQTYYSNPLGDKTAPSSTVGNSECLFNVSAAVGSTTCDLTVDIGDFSGGGIAMTNSNNGTNGATTFGAYVWYSGMTYSNKVISKNAGSNKMYTTGLAAGNSLMWGAEITTRTDHATSSSASTSTMTITATEH